MTHTLQQFKEEIEKEFERKFASTTNDRFTDLVRGDTSYEKKFYFDVKSFLSQSQDRIIRKVVEMIREEIGEDEKLEDYNSAYHEGINARNVERSRLRSFLTELSLDK